MILVDTSVWVDHLRRDDGVLVRLLNAGRVLVHPWVLGELACGRLKRRSEVLGLLHRLPRASTATDPEALRLIEQHNLPGRGIGWVDVHLLAASLLTPCHLHSRDRALRRAAADLGVLADLS